MSNRSLKTLATGQAKAKQALLRKGWTHDYLAAQAGLSTRHSIANQFLVDCLNSDCSATSAVRKAIVSRLLLAES